LNFYPRHIGDYLKDTAHLSLLEHGVYGRLLDVYYTRETPIPDADVYRLVGARTKEERGAVETVLNEFFDLSDAVWSHKRCDAEIERYHDKQGKAKASAEKRWSHTERNANASPDAMRTHSDGNAPNNQEPITTIAPKVHRVRASRLPADWQPGDEGMAYAAKQGLSHGQTLTQLESFRDWWAAAPGQKGVKADWPATWRTWCRKAAADGPAKQSFQERATASKAALLAEMTGGLLGSKANVIEMEVGNAPRLTA
jgi:uncharacterized protein YdaU (DUF1376 family)